MWRRILLISALAASLAAQAPAPPAVELERIDSLIEQLTRLKAEVATIEQRLDALLRTLSEQRGAVQVKPAPYNALKASPTLDSAADPKPTRVRCAAITAAGTRCMRAAVTGARYCKQHQLAHQK